jgi:hypothetical protein
MANIVYANPFGSYVQGQQEGQKQAIDLATAQRTFRDSDLNAEFAKWYMPHRQKEVEQEEQQRQLATQTAHMQMIANFAMMGDAGAQKEFSDYVSQMTGGKVNLNFNNLKPAERIWATGVASGKINPVLGFKGILSAGDTHKFGWSPYAGYPYGGSGNVDPTTGMSLGRMLNPGLGEEEDDSGQSQRGQSGPGMPVPTPGKTGGFRWADGTGPGATNTGPPQPPAAPTAPAGALVTPTQTGTVAGGVPAQAAIPRTIVPGQSQSPISLKSNYSGLPDNDAYGFSGPGEGAVETNPEVGYSTAVSHPATKQYGTPSVTVGQPITVPRSVTPPWVPTKTPDDMPVSPYNTDRVRGQVKRTVGGV